MKKVLSFCLVVLFVVGMIPINAFAVSNHPENQHVSDFFAEEVTEYLTLDGTDYRIDYYYQGELRVIEITNCVTEQVDVLKYSPSSGEMFYNESPFDVELGDYTPQADGEWTFTPWTGDATYGPFRIIMDNQTASIEPGYELQ